MRDATGRFVRGCPPGPGRPPKAREAAYLQATADACSLDDWRLIVKRAVSDAVAGDAAARTWLSRMLIGDVVRQPEHDDDEPLDDEKLRLLVGLADHLDAVDGGDN